MHRHVSNLFLLLQLGQFVLSLSLLALLVKHMMHMGDGKEEGCAEDAGLGTELLCLQKDVDQAGSVNELFQEGCYYDILQR